MSENEKESSQPLLMEDTLDKKSVIIEMPLRQESVQPVNVYIDPAFESEPYQLDIEKPAIIYTEFTDDFINIDDSIRKITSQQCEIHQN